MITDPSGEERREYFRVPTLARVTLRVLAPEEREAARAQMRVRHVPALGPASLEELRLAPEAKPVLELLQRLALTLERIERKIDAMPRMGRGQRKATAAQLLEIVLSGSGFSGALETQARIGELVEAEIELCDAGIPVIPAVARLHKIHSHEGARAVLAFAFEDILPEDRERIIQFTLRTQAEEIRKKRMGEMS